MSEERKTQLFDVMIYNGKSLLGVVTVTAEDEKDASNIAVRDMNVKIRKNYG